MELVGGGTSRESEVEAVHRSTLAEPEPVDERSLRLTRAGFGFEDQQASFVTRLEAENRLLDRARAIGGDSIEAHRLVSQGVSRAGYLDPDAPDGVLCLGASLVDALSLSLHGERKEPSI
jgi:hypothetical protein